MEREKYISLFVDESKENLLALNDYLLELEKGSGDLHLLNDIFRVAHTLKGMASTMGFKEITELTHEMENLLDFLRNAQLAVNSEIIDVLFLCLDSLEILANNIVTEKPQIVDTTNLMYRLKKLIRLGSGKSEIEDSRSNGEDRDTYSTTYNHDERELIKESVNNGYFVSEIEILLMKDSIMKSLRVHLVLKTIESKAKIIKTNPEKEKLNEGEFGRNFIVTVIHSGNIESIKESILSIAEVVKVYTEDISLKFKEEKIEKKNNRKEKSSFERITYNSTEKNVLLEALEQNFSCYEIYVSLMPDTVMKSIRATMVVNSVQEIDCQIIKSIPSSSELLTDNLEENFALTIISDKDENLIKEKVLNISEIKEVEILKLLKPYLKDSDTVNDKENVLIEFNDYEKMLIVQAKTLNRRVILIGINLMPGTVMKYARFIIVSKKLEIVGEIIKTFPAYEDIESENFNDYFQVVLITQSNNKEIKDIVASVAEITNIIELNSVIADDASNDVTLKNEIDDKKIDKIKSEMNLVPPKEVINEEKISKKELDDDRKNKKSITKKPTIRVDMDRLDELINLVEELTIIKSRLSKISSDFLLPELTQSVRNLSSVSGNLQNNAMRLRMIPVEHIFNRFPRMIRDISKTLNKEINFIMEGEETELDRTIIDEIGDPLVHMLRNSADHGIESQEERIKSGKNKIGTIKLVARHEGNNVLIIVEDDGGGINTEKVKKKAIEKKIITLEQSSYMTEEELKKIIFLPGFSTSDSTTDISGRGVGMDAVISKVNSIGGSISVDSELGKGSRFTIKLPLTLAIMEVLLVELGDETYAVPITFIEEVKELLDEEIKNINKVKVTVLRDKTIPLLELGDMLNVKRTKPKTILDPEIYTPTTSVIIVRTEEGMKTNGLIVDKIIGQEDVVIKPLGRFASDKKNYISGTANLGDGNLALILNVTSLT